jgi:hypothetical protein
MNALERGLILAKGAAAVRLWFGSLLLCSAGSNLVADEHPESTNRIAVKITHPCNHAVIASLNEIKGSTVSQGGIMDVVQVRLKSVAGGKPSDWQSAEWIADQNTNAQRQLTEWRILAPQLKEGAYEIECQATRAGKIIMASNKSTFVIDRTAPVISFFPLHDQTSVVDFSEIGGEVDKTAEIQFSICRVNDSEELNRYWNGSEWIANPENSGVKLHGSSNRDYWFPSAETPLPKSTQIGRGMYLISASAVDRAGNRGRAAITVRKTGAPSNLESTALSQ